MIEREKIAFDKYESQGYDVIKAGAPDLILLKDGAISFIEVKSEVDKLSEPQERAFDLLKKHGFEARIETVTPMRGQTFLAPHKPLFLRDMTEDEIEVFDAYLNLDWRERLHYKNSDDFQKQYWLDKERLGR